MNDFQREIHMRHALMDSTCADDVNVFGHVAGHIIFRQAAADFDEEGTPGRMRAFQPARHARRIGGGEIVEHDDVGAGGEGFLGVGFRLAFDLDLEAEAGGGFGAGDGASDRPG